MEHRLTITIDGHGESEESAERFLAGFEETHPEVGPVVAQNLVRQTLTVTFSLDVDDVDQAYELGRPVFRDGASASDLEPAPILSIEIEVVTADELEHELQPA